MSDSNCLYSALSVRMVGNNSLIHLLRILASLELFLNNEFYSRHPVLTNVYNNGKTVLGKKIFCSFESVFELARRLRHSQTSINNKDLGPLVKKEAENICKDSIWLSFLCVLALFSVICRPIHLFYVSCVFQKYQKIFNQKIYPRERCSNNKCFVLLWTCLYKKANHLSLNNHFVPLLKLLMSTENKLKRKHGHREKVGSVSKVQKKMDNFFLKEFKKY